MASHEEYLWKDPFDPASSGPVLLSDQIHFLADEVSLIEPFDEKYLRPAAYDLRVGDCYYVEDERRDLVGESIEIEIPPNGLVYIKTKEKFNIPYYLVARYSLRVHQVYRGLLIDNGLHIDPGFCGHIWIPVHNFTMQPRILSAGDEFLSVEFNRTTPLPIEVNSISNQAELVSRGIQNQLKGMTGRAIKVFYKTPERFAKRNDDFTPRLFWDKFPGEKHKSATLGTEKRLDSVERAVEGKITALADKIESRLDYLRNLGGLAVAGLIIGILGIVLGISLPILYAEYGKTREAMAQRVAEIKVLQEQLQEQKARIDAILLNQSSPNRAPDAKPRQPNGK